MVTLPESLKTYRDKAFKTAIDRVGGADKIPDEFTVSDCREFHLAQLSYQKIKTDYWVFLHDLWLETWGNVLKKHPEERFGNYNAWVKGTNEVGLDEIFEYSEIWNVHSFRDGMIMTWVDSDIQEDSDIQIGFRLTDIDGEITEDFKKKDPAQWLGNFYRGQRI